MRIPTALFALILLAACEGGDGSPDGSADASVDGAADASADGSVDGAVDSTVLPTSWMPYTEDQNFDRGDGRITGFPAIISYGEGDAYPMHIGRIHDDIPVGECEIVDDALMGVAPALRCNWTATYEESADPAMGR